MSFTKTLLPFEGAPHCIVKLIFEQMLPKETHRMRLRPRAPALRRRLLATLHAPLRRLGQSLSRAGSSRLSALEIQEFAQIEVRIKGERFEMGF